MGKMLEILHDIHDIEDGVAFIKEIGGKIQEEHGLYPTMAEDEEYRKLEVKALKDKISEEEIGKIQEKAVKFANKEIMIQKKTRKKILKELK